MILSVLLQGAGTTAFAEGTVKQVDAQITNLMIQNLSGQTVNSMWYTDKFYLAIDWDASTKGADLHEDDHFDITLPDKMVFPSDGASVDFNIYGSDSITVIGKAHVTLGSENKGETVRIMFTDWVEGKENVKGNIRLSAQFDRTQVTLDEENYFSVSVSGQVTPVTSTITVVGSKKLNPEFVGKWRSSTSSLDQAAWWVCINRQESNLTNMVISDNLGEGTSSEIYIADSFKLERVEMNSFGNITTVYEGIDLINKLTITLNRKSFTIDLGATNGNQFYLSCCTTYTSGTTLHNNVTLTSNEQSVTKPAMHISADLDSSGTGTLANKIKLTKVDAEDNSITLPDTVFLKSQDQMEALLNSPLVLMEQLLPVRLFL